jgi:hypothetical protein
MPTFTREELYDLVWTTPVRTLARQFGVSDVWVKKVCSGASIPVPERGYWAKVQAGRKLPRFPLPPREPGASHLVSIGKEPQSYRWDPEAELAQPIPDPPVFEESIEAVIPRIVRKVGKVARSRDLSSPAGPLRKALEKDDRRREKLRESPYAVWNTPLFDSPFERRRMRLLNALCLGLIKAGAAIQVRDDEARDVSVNVGGTSVALSLDHPHAKPDRHGRTVTRPGPADTLKLQIGRTTDVVGFQGIWQDADDAKLEDQLTAITINIITAGEVYYRANQVSHHEWLKQRRQENEAEVRRRREEAEKRAREQRLRDEKERRDLLFSQSQAWRTAQDIRGFVRDVVGQPRGELSIEDLQAWSDWALAEADALDPALNGQLKLPPKIAT